MFSLQSYVLQGTTAVDITVNEIQYCSTQRSRRVGSGTVLVVIVLHADGATAQ